MSFSGTELSAAEASVSEASVPEAANRGWKSKASLIVGVGVPLAVLAGADSASADTDIGITTSDFDDSMLGYDFSQPSFSHAGFSDAYSQAPLGDFQDASFAEEQGDYPRHQLTLDGGLSITESTSYEVAAYSRGAGSITMAQSDESPANTSTASLAGTDVTYSGSSDGEVATFDVDLGFNLVDRFDNVGELSATFPSTDLENVELTAADETDQALTVHRSPITEDPANFLVGDALQVRASSNGTQEFLVLHENGSNEGFAATATETSDGHSLEFEPIVTGSKDWTTLTEDGRLPGGYDVTQSSDGNSFTLEKPPITFTAHSQARHEGLHWVITQTSPVWMAGRQREMLEPAPPIDLFMDLKGATYESRKP